MSAQDAKIASLVSRFNEPTTSSATPADVDDEEIFAELEAEIENDSSALFRERGMDRLKAEMEHLQQQKRDGHGQYREVTDEKEVIRLSAKEPRCVIHFFHHKFKRCEIMDKHLQRLAPKYFNTLFIRVFVENVPWLVERLGIQVLPCVMTFVNGTSKDRIVGFEDLGNSDQFETATLEWKLLNSGVIQKDESFGPSVVYGSKPAVRQHIRGKQSQGDDSDFDLDE
ncbi:GTPase inhibitor [Lentinus tigrinus ALCF2SS1-7]|uniref:GTPase inhibitor n=1 Tax=Lentinus tigrinus ALCF2SS1-6 TaxID=1328759 RepID=A0A5C2SW12_9APHY|nr:GTPase inhibitor [Lentinus tigrinus ALCF2SS1-6]RPD81179.1 GTPase inhibitor [Lentinus tigrinus ALCF2SS1-7]